MIPGRERVGDLNVRCPQFNRPHAMRSQYGSRPISLSNEDKMKHAITYFAAAALSLSLYGCGSPSASESTNQSTPPTAGDGSGTHDDHSDDEHGQSDDSGLSDMEKMKVELAKLSAEDAASAEQQHMCPVSGKMLGTMGAPIKVGVDGQQVWICCEGCRKSLLENPSEYLAKLQHE